MGVFALAREQAQMRASPDYVSFYRIHQVEWIAGMCALVGIPTPPEVGCLALAEQATTTITRRVRAAICQHCWAQGVPFLGTIPRYR
jgi:hypothetical protein